MSLINQMLQDLDARGSTGAAALQMDIKPVLREERRLSLPVVLGLAGGALAVAVGGAVAWRYLQKPPAAAAVVTKPAVIAMRPVPKVLPVAQPVPAPVAAATVGWARPANAPVSTRTAPDDSPPANLPAARADAPQKAAPPKRVPTEAAAKPQPVALAAQRAATPPPAKPAAAETPVRRGEDVYRRALASLQDGRITETIALLEQALQIEPRHDAARQTLIGLLVESGRVDEAMRQLQQALAADARQPTLAMLLARLQIERGASGIETLTRTLPYAGGNGEYQAFLAGALQRQARHAEAAEQYQAALRSAPGNGVWWMGLGISLQADKRNPEAVAAFRRAQAVGALAPELQAFVERKLQQLAR